MSKIRIGFVGVGNMGQCAHLVNYRTIDDCEVVAIAELRQDLARQVAARYGVPHVYADHRAMLDAEKLDGIVASQPYRRHGVLVPELLDAGLPILTEKPLAGTLEAGGRIVSALKKSKGRLFIGYTKRSDPATIYAKQEIARWKESGELGALRYVRILMPAGDWVVGGFNHLIRSDDPRPDLPLDPPPSDMDEEAARRFDAFVNYYIHQVNLMRHLLGENYHVTHADPTGVLLVAESDGGVPAILEMSPYHTTLDWQEEALVAFDKGYIRLELPAPLAINRPGKVTLLRDPGAGKTPETVIPRLPWVHAMRQQAIHFVQAIRGEPTPLCEAEEALEDLNMARQYFELFTGR